MSVANNEMVCAHKASVPICPVMYAHIAMSLNAVGSVVTSRLEVSGTMTNPLKMRRL